MSTIVLFLLQILQFIYEFVAVRFARGTLHEKNNFVMHYVHLSELQILQFIRKDPLATALLLQDQGITNVQELRSRCRFVEATPAPPPKKAHANSGKKSDRIFATQVYEC